jgi:hypothetical protein
MHTKKIAAGEAMLELQATRHEIGFENAKAMVKRFGRFRNKLRRAKRNGMTLPDETPVFPDCLTFNKAAIYRLMKIPGCAGIRCWMAINEKQEFRLVIVAVDEKGGHLRASGSGDSEKTIANAGVEEVLVLDEGQASPPYPPKGF